MKKVKSSHIDAYHYDEDKRQLVVQFKNGHIYEYDGVLPHEHQALETAESVGKHLIKHVFPKKISRKRPI